jgi:hypothetical protein
MKNLTLVDPSVDPKKLFINFCRRAKKMEKQLVTLYDGKYYFGIGTVIEWAFYDLDRNTKDKYPDLLVAVARAYMCVPMDVKDLEETCMFDDISSLIKTWELGGLIHPHYVTHNGSHFQYYFEEQTK